MLIRYQVSDYRQTNLLTSRSALPALMLSPRPFAKLFASGVNVFEIKPPIESLDKRGFVIRPSDRRDQRCGTVLIELPAALPTMEKKMIEEIKELFQSFIAPAIEGVKGDSRIGSVNHVRRK